MDELHEVSDGDRAAVDGEVVNFRIAAVLADGDTFAEHVNQLIEEGVLAEPAVDLLGDARIPLFEDDLVEEKMRVILSRIVIRLPMIHRLQKGENGRLEDAKGRGASVILENGSKIDAEGEKFCRAWESGEFVGID